MAVRITLKRASRARQRHLWVWRRDVVRVLGPPDPSVLAEIVDHRGRTLGWGTYAPDAPIVARVITWGESPAPDWFERRLAAALDRRTTIAETSTGYREVNSEGDGLPGLVIDRFGDARVVQVTTAAMDARVGALLGWLGGRAPNVDTIVLRPEAAAAREGFVAGCEGPALEELRWQEHGLTLTGPPPPSQKTGAYHDQRENRRRVAALAAELGQPVLDIGCHVGGFALHAARAGLNAVGLDSSERVLIWARRNATLLGAGAGATRWVRGDMFAALEDPELRGPFGVAVFDPPKVVTHRRDLGRASRAMTQALKNVIPRVAHNGMLVVCSCSHALDADGLDVIVEAASGDRAITPLADGRWGPGEDHPVDPDHPEGNYLRVNAYRFDGSR